METEHFEERVMRLSSRGIMARSTAVEIVNVFSECEEKRDRISEIIEEIEKMNDEAPDFFIRLNQLINEIL